MSFAESWNWLRTKRRWNLTTAHRIPLTVTVSAESIKFESPNAQVRYLSKDVFEKWFHLWFDKGIRKSADFRNQTGERSKAENIRLAKRVFKLISEHEADVIS